jgi:hypothetical protein
MPGVDCCLRPRDRALTSLSVRYQGNELCIVCASMAVLVAGQVGCAALCAILLCACSSRADTGGGPGQHQGPTGKLAFIDTAGRLVVSGLSSGATSTFPELRGQGVAPALSPDGRLVAVGGQQPHDFDASVHVADVGSVAVREIAPVSGQRAAFRWGVGLFVNGAFIVPEQATEGRRAGTNYVHWVLPSTFGRRVVYSECIDGTTHSPPLDCPSRLVLESAAGDSRVVLAAGGASWPLGFTPDDHSIVVLEQVGTERHVIVHDMVSTSARDLGVADDELYTGEGFAPRGGSLISPDGREILVPRGGAIRALRLDGSGERVVAFLADEDEERMAFAANGTVVIELQRDVSPSDTLEFRVTLAVSSGGEARQISSLRKCGRSVLSPTGRTLARWCEDGINIHHLPDGSLIRPIPRFTDVFDWWPILGIDANDSGVIVARGPFVSRDAEYTLLHIALDGTETVLGQAKTFVGLDGFARNPFSYVP